ncbi:hypothetical protein GeomeDRAFT_1571 [Geobacter metallireducens RCH3]|uniref:Lipoprotein, putative n=1 Tax=Geobacter metallireducens (strain ATCC 53774 / DSM 7210 / GS-15) TaxID=269799 RepID=Q39U46_GEOMG|nr:hypothetical protein [Geobacter metallireducens]ABB32228.1 lipoprotein, putative [Geobacter metallireducens GS-15]EHP87004.1 hypothetical protein GeomeDRAFT_1571 [Geobacter metallireducens RCH3]
MKMAPKSIAARWFLTLLLTVSLTVLLFACRETASSESEGSTRSWAESEAKKVVATIRKGHPRIYLTPERIPALKTEALTTKAKQWSLMHQRMGGKQAALFYAMGIGPEHGAKMSRNDYGRMAAKALTDAISGGSKAAPDDLAVLYDWAHGALTQQEKRAFVDFCKKRIGKEIRIHNEKTYGYRASPRPEGIVAALAFYGDGIDDAYAEKLLVTAIRETLRDNLAMEQVAGKDGGFADGTYYIFQLGGTFNPFLALSTATRSSFFLDQEVFARLPNHLIQALLPFPIERAKTGKAFRYFATFHDNWTATTTDYGSVGKGMATNMAITAAEYRRKGDEKTASLYMWLVKEAFGGIPYQAENPVSFVLLDETIPPLGPKEVGLPLAEALGWDERAGEIDRDRFGKKAGIGWVAMRSAWNDPDATYALFKAEPFYYHGHMHHDSLAFMIAKGEELALARSGNYMCWYEGGPLRDKNPGWPQAANFFTRTISTNNLLIYDPNEDFGGWANDGGQRITTYWDDKWGRTYNGTANGNYRDIGGLVRFERSDRYVYTAADATRAYNSTAVTTGKSKAKVSLVQREFVYLRSPGGDDDYFVVFDRVDAVKPDFKKLWLLQLRARPEFDGSAKVTVGNESGGIHRSENTSRITVRQERSQLRSTTLLPKKDNRVVRRLGGSMATTLRKPLRSTDNGPIDIEVASTAGLPEHPTVIITNQPPDPNREVFDRYSVWPQAAHASGKSFSDRVAYFCDGRTRLGQSPAKLLDCVRAIKSSPGADIPAGARVIQEFRHMGVEGVDRDNDAGRIDYPWGYGFGYSYGDGNQYGLWRVEVSPKKHAKLDNFLHVLHPSLKGSGGSDAVLIESRDDSLYGALIGNRAVLFAKGADFLTKGSYPLSGNGKVWQLLCDLKPGRDYQVRQDGKVVATVTASAQGTLTFESLLAGRQSQFEFSVVTGKGR